MTQHPPPQYLPDRPPPSEKPPPVQPGSPHHRLVLGVMVVFIISVMVPPSGMTLAGIGLIWSTIALLRKTAAQRVAVARLFVWLGLLVVQVAVILPVHQNIGRLRTATGCQASLTLIGKAIAAYTSDHAGHYPPDLETLVVAGHLHYYDAMECSAGRTASGRATQFYKHAYCAPQDDGDAQNDVLTILASDITSARRPTGLFDIISFEQYRYVLLSDLSIRQYTETEFQRELLKPQNRHFAEELAKGPQLIPWELWAPTAPVPPAVQEQQSPGSQPSSQGTQRETDE